MATIMMMHRLIAEPGKDAALYLKSYDLDADDGRGDVTLTSDPGEALRFKDVREALEAWKAPSTVRPIRPDGRPNRPLTAWTAELMRVED